MLFTTLKVLCVQCLSSHAANHQRAFRGTQSTCSTKAIPTLDQVERPHGALPAKATDKDLDNGLKHNRTVLFNRWMHHPAARSAIFTVATTFPVQCPLVLLVKVGWRQGKALGDEDGKWLLGICYMLQRENKEILEDDANMMPSTIKQTLRFLLQVNSVQISLNEKIENKLTSLCRYCILACGDCSTTRWRPAHHFGFCVWRMEHNCEQEMWQ